MSCLTRRSSRGISLIAILTAQLYCLLPQDSEAFTARSLRPGGPHVGSLSLSDADFSSFAATLEDDSDSTTASSTSTKAAPKTKATATTTSSFATKNPTWQDALEELMDPVTPVARRQILLSDLLSSNEQIRASVQQALRDGKIDPLLTPTGKKLQDGSRAVARQLTNDILPSLAGSANSNISRRSPPNPFDLLPQQAEVNRVGTRIFNALQNQVQRNLETLQGDLADPTRIPGRVAQQGQDLVKEAGNIFQETPVGLKEPPYTVVSKTDSYEIRDYQAYQVATTNMASADEAYSMDSVAQSGAAFNSLAAYLFGANKQSAVMEMTTPVTTTMTGEMRFYLATDNQVVDPPEPLKQDESKSVYETGQILIQEIPPARLAVRRFTGFCTAGEISRQKQALLTALQLDSVELDIEHGQTVGHLVFQYNPPYTLPMVRRNEIAVPVLDEDGIFQEEELGIVEDDKESYDERINGDMDVSPSD